MQQILFQIPVRTPLNLGPFQIPVFGVGSLLAILVILCAWWGYRYFCRMGFDTVLQGQVMFQGLLALIIWKLPAVTDVINIYGYGMAMVCGFLCGSWLAAYRAKREGLDPHVIWDVGMTVLFSGVIGARVFFIIKNPGDFFGGGRTLLQTLFELVNLPKGGLVLYGGVILGIFAFILHCRYLKISALKMADILMPAIFVGEMFGRIGCFLNGCCYGAPVDPSIIPWAVQFPPGSVPFNAEVAAGLIKETAQCSLPLHPAQIYSSLNALVLAVVTWYYFPHRSRDGAVLLLGWSLYPITRFGLELLRNDTPGEFGTSLTIAQWVSMAMLLGAAGFAVFLSMRPKSPSHAPPSGTLSKMSSK